MTHNPIIQRELIGLLRQPRTVAMQILFVAALALLVLAVWPDSAQVNLGGRQAQQLFSVFIYGMLGALMLLAPAMPAMAIVRERQQKTLTLLLTSPLTPASILIGKVSGALGFILLLLVLSLPAAAACYVMGGIALTQLLTAYALLALVATQYALLALFVSASVKSTDAALRMTYGLVLLLSVIVLGPYYMLQGQLIGPSADATEWLAALSPIPAVMQVIGDQNLGTRGLAADVQFVQKYALLAAASIVLCIIGILRRLQPHVTDRPRAKGIVTDEQTTAVRAGRRLMFLWFFDPHKRTGAIADYENPVMMKEFRTRAFGRAHWMARLLGSCLVVSLLLMLMSTKTQEHQLLSPSYMGGVMVIFQMGLIVLITPALSAAVISSEVESGGWVLLQMTPLRPRNIVMGKLLSVAFTLILLLLATLPGYAVLLEIDSGETARVLNVLISLSLTALFALLLGAACSSVFRRTATATTCAYLILIGLCVLTLLPWLGEGALFGHNLVQAVLVFNPLAAALAEINMPGLADYNLIPANWVFLVIASALCAIVLWVRTWQLTRPQ